MHGMSEEAFLEDFGVRLSEALRADRLSVPDGHQLVVTGWHLKGLKAKRRGVVTYLPCDDDAPRVIVSGNRFEQMPSPGLLADIICEFADRPGP